jgi:hypothetical protein
LIFGHGLNKNSVVPGLVVMVEVYPAREVSGGANGRDVTLPDGRKLFLSGAGDGP